MKGIVVGKSDKISVGEIRDAWDEIDWVGGRVAGLRPWSTLRACKEPSFPLMAR